MPRIGSGDAVARRVCGEVGRDQFDHLPGADEQYVQVADRAENLLGQPHGGGGHRHRVRPDRRLAADFLGHGEGTLEQLVQQGAEAAGGFRRAHGVLHLAENLRFTQHHRVQPARHAERVPGCGLGVVHVQVRLQPVHRQLVVVRHPGQRIAHIRRVTVDLGAVTGGQDRHFVRRVRAHHARQRVPQPFGREGELLADGERRGLVIEAEGYERHVRWS